MAGSSIPSKRSSSRDSNLQEILDARERRWKHRLSLAKRHTLPVISVTLNVPGPRKTLDIYAEAHRKILKALLQVLSDRNLHVVSMEDQMTPAGPETLLVTDCTARTIKLLSVRIEETHPLGRLADIDVMDGRGRTMSRKDLDLEERRCLLCSDLAHICAASRRHSLDSLLKEIDRILFEAGSSERRSVLESEISEGEK